MATNEMTDQWDIVCLPSMALGDYPSEEKQHEMMQDGVFLPLADPLGRRAGEALWQERFNSGWLGHRKEVIGDYDFEALFQQMPYLREGGLFKRSYFEMVSTGPGREVKFRVRYWDKAATRKGNRTAGALVSMGKDDYLYIEHVASEKMTPHQREQMMVRIGLGDYETLGRFEIWHPQDPGSAGLDSAMATNDNLANAGLVAHYEPVSGDKLARAHNFASKAEGGRVRMVRGAWNESVLNRLVAFTGKDGDEDDEVDAISSAVNKILEKTRRVKESRIL
jgi:predicted phage terminase large subunit-like protein